MGAHAILCHMIFSPLYMFLFISVIYTGRKRWLAFQTTLLSHLHLGGMNHGVFYVKVNQSKLFVSNSKPLNLPKISNIFIFKHRLP